MSFASSSPAWGAMPNSNCLSSISYNLLSGQWYRVGILHVGNMQVRLYLKQNEKAVKGQAVFMQNHEDFYGALLDENL